MSNRRPKQKSLMECLGLMVFVALVVIAVTLLTPHKVQRAGVPKRVEADGITYLACQGVLWLPNERWVVGDTEAQGYEVRFRDAHGVDHELHRVRMLRISDLPSDTPECVNSR
jgi:hypothetical protein